MDTITKVFSYTRSDYSFFERLQEIFNHKTSLEEIYLLDIKNNIVTFENDTNLLFQRIYYDSKHYDAFRNLYYSFIKNEIFKLFPEEEYLVLQKDPCLPVSNPNNTALGIKAGDTNDKIGMHSDSDYNHPPEEINYILAITEMWESNSVYIESSYNSGIFNPIRLKWNEYIQFYGNKLRHYNMRNITGQSRVSLDFRVIPFSKYNANYNKSSIHGNRRFIIDDYYIKIKRLDV